jgi:DNA ligase-1
MKNRSFNAFAALLQEIAETRSTREKIRLFSRWLKECETAEPAALSARWACEGPFSKAGGLKAVAGSALTSAALCELVGIDQELDFKLSKTALGSTTETIEKLLDNLYWYGNPAPLETDFRDVMQRFEELARLRLQEHKRLFLKRLYTAYSGNEVKYFLRIAGGHSLRIGFETKSVLQAIAEAFDAQPDAVQRAWLFTGDAGETARLAFENRLSDARFALFHPIPFMLAGAYSPDDAAFKAEEYAAEIKFDGMRVQVHVEDGRVELFSRDLNPLSESFPDALAFFKKRRLAPVIFDGELFVSDATGVPVFNALQQRMGVKKPKPELVESFPVQFVAYDLLFADGIPQMENPWQERRAKLVAIGKACDIPVSEVYTLDSEETIAALFSEAKMLRHEGLMLKHKLAAYEAGQRRKSWLKVKQPEQSLTTVILYAHAGSGKRGGQLSDFTLGVRSSDAAGAPFVPIGKAYGGYTNDQLLKLNAALKPLALEFFGPTVMVKPALVVELEFDEIQENKRTKAGFSLRFPRFKSIRWELGPEDCDTLAVVKARYDARRNPDKSTGPG